MAYADSNGSDCELFRNHHILHKEIGSINQSCQNTKIILKDQLLEILVQLFDQLNIYLRFHIQPQYPVLLPEISVSSDCLTKTETFNLQRILTSKAKASISQPMLLSLVNEACQYLSKTNQDVAMLINDKACKTNYKAKIPLKKVARDFSNVAGTNEKKNRKGKKDIFISDCNESDVKIDDLHPSTNLDSCDVLSIYVKRQTHFIAIRITDGSIVQNLTNIQNQLVRKEPLLTKGLFTKDIFHLTLCSLGLDTNDDINKCIDILDIMKQDLQAYLPQTKLVVHGMSQFYNRAIYAKVRHGEDFIRLYKLLRDRLENSCVEIRDEHEVFTPHVTIIKVKRPERKLFGSRNIEPSMYSPFLETVFGEQAVDNIFLCEMGGQRRPDGFYVTLHEMSFR